MKIFLQQIEQHKQNQQEQFQRLKEHQQQQEQQQQLSDEINRAVMFQRMQQISRPAAQMGMVSVRF